MKEAEGYVHTNMLNLNGSLTLVMSTKAVLFLGAPLGEEDERLVWG